MTSAQKIIKYIANGFAIFLIVTIISTILTLTYALFSSLNLINTNKNIITEELKVISHEVSSFQSLKIDLIYTNLYIKSGEKLAVQTNNKKIKFIETKGNVKIEEENRYWLNNNIESNLIVYLPTNIPLLDEVDIDTDSGKIFIEFLNTKKLSLELGAGEVQIENIVSTEETEIEGGVGKTELKQCNLNNLKVDLSVGEFRFNGKLTGNNKIKSGIGTTNIELIGVKEDYTINAGKGLGNITLDKEKIVSDKVYGNGKNYLKVDGGIGEININFIN